MLTNLGLELKTARQARGLSLQAISIPADMSAAYVHKLEQGKVETPSPRSLRRLGEELGIPYTRLLGMAGYLEEADLKSGRSLGTDAADSLFGHKLSESERQAVQAFVRLLVEQRSLRTNIPQPK